MGSSEPSVLVIGAGAVGCFVGARLALGGAGVTLVGRGGLVEAARSSGLLLSEPEGERRTPPLAAYSSVGEALAAAKYDLAVLTVKAYDTAVVIAEMASARMPPPPVLSLQNGIGNEDALAQALGDDKVIAGAIETPLTVPAAGQVVAHRSRYRLGLAPVGRLAPVAEAAAALTPAGLRVDLFDNHRSLKWSKLLLNLPANAACAILDWTPAQIMARPDTAALEARAWQEAFRVMAGQGIGAVSLAGYPLSLLAPIVPTLPASLLAAGCGARSRAGAAVSHPRCGWRWPRASGPRSPGSTGRSRLPAPLIVSPPRLMLRSPISSPHLPRAATSGPPGATCHRG